MLKRLLSKLEHAQDDVWIWAGDADLRDDRGGRHAARFQSRGAIA